MVRIRLGQQEHCPADPAGSGPLPLSASCARKQPSWLSAATTRLSQLEMLPLAQNRLPCIKQIPQLRSPCASLYYFPTKMRSGNFCSLSSTNRK